LEERLVAAGDADADVIVQDIDTTPAPHCLCHRRGKHCFARDVGFECHALETLGCHHGGGFGGGIEAAIDGENVCALASKPQYRRSTVADAFAGALPSANNDSNLVFKTHNNAPR
jgi:hypothetical protein